MQACFHIPSVKCDNCRQPHIWGQPIQGTYDLPRPTTVISVEQYERLMKEPMFFTQPDKDGDAIPSDNSNS